MNNHEYLKKCKSLRPHEIIKILEDFRVLSGQSSGPRSRDRTILISMKVEESLLKDFREKCKTQNLKYQAQIKVLMREWLASSD